MTALQIQVRDFIKNNRTIKEGKNLYNSLPNKSNAMQHNFNRMTSSEKDVRLLCYELCKAVGISTSLHDVLMNKPVNTVAQNEIKHVAVKHVADKDAYKESYDLLKIDLDSMSYPALKKYYSKVQKQMDLKAPNDFKASTLIAALALARDNELEDIAVSVPQPVKKAIALRDQFPFLRDKDCPLELKALVNDLITARENYVAGHKRLFESMTQDQETALSQEIVENFIENKQAFAELEHYREHNEILGEHPSFKKMNMEKSLQELSTPDLTKKVNSLRKNISTNKSKAESLSDGDDKLEELSDKVADYEWQLEVVLDILKTR